MPLDYLEDEYDTRDCAALKVSFKVFNNVWFYLEKYFFQLLTEFGFRCFLSIVKKLSSFYQSKFSFYQSTPITNFALIIFMRQVLC